MTSCRVCGSSAIAPAGDVEYLQGYRYSVYDCAACGCRMTPHDAAVHDAFHQHPSISYYQDYVTLAEQCATLFRAGDVDGLRRELSASPKYRYVIEHVDRTPATARLLEVGCARGHLTSYSILKRRDVLGIDVSPAAVAAARRMFGNHFAVANTPEAAARGPFDLIYHVGLIGCVADPIGLTRQLLSELRPGGQLLFNAPNRNALYLRGQLWLDSAPPPDVVTLFPEGFWGRMFGDAAAVTEAIEEIDTDASLRIAVRQHLSVSWRPPVAQPSAVRAFHWRQPSTGVTAVIARGAAKAARMLRLGNLVTPRVAEFGILVRLVKPA